jgi:6-phosphogluconolactonase
MTHDFPTQTALADALAAYIASAITTRLQTSPTCAIALSGGRTPIKFFEALSKQPLNWPAVTITLVDDRWVPESSTRSNAALLRHHLLQGPAAAATFLPLVNEAASPESGWQETEATIATLPLPFAAIVLGMGIDGHTASFFPGGDRLAEALAPPLGHRIETLRAQAAEEPRITLTLPALLEADRVAIHIEGDEKRRVLAAAEQPGPATIMPIRAILARRPPPDIFWSP